MKRFIKRLFDNRPTRTTRKPTRRTPLALEQLEARALLSASVSVGTHTIDIGGDWSIGQSFGERRVVVDSVTITGTGLKDEVHVFKRSGHVHVTTISGSEAPRDVDLTEGGSRDVSADLVVNFFGRGGDDTFNNHTGFETWAFGGAGDDTLIGGTGVNHLNGELDNDTLVGSDTVTFDTDGAFVNFLLGGPGNDTVFGGAGKDLISGGSGNDYLDGQGGDDLILGQEGNDTIYGGAGSDALVGGDNDDQLFGEAGFDQLDGGDGADYLDGGIMDGFQDDLLGGPGPDQFLSFGSTPDHFTDLQTAEGDTLVYIVSFNNNITQAGDIHLSDFRLGRGVWAITSDSQGVAADSGTTYVPVSQLDPALTVRLADLLAAGHMAVPESIRALSATDPSALAAVPAFATVEPYQAHAANAFADLPAGDQAYQVDQSLGLHSTGNLWFNWGGRYEKWLLGNGDKWYFITPDGGLYRWDNSPASALTGARVATLDPVVWARPELLYDAQPGPALIRRQLARRAYQLDQSLGLSTTGDLYFNWGGKNEKWLLGDGGQWYFVTPDGGLYRWDNSPAGALTGARVATLDSTYWANPELLYNARPADPLADFARRTDQALGLYSDGNLWFNWGGQGDKWFLSTSFAGDPVKEWFYVVPELSADGTLAYNVYQWGGAAQGSLGAASASERLIATLDFGYWANPDLLYNAV